jgi:hypothetical protein
MGLGGGGGAGEFEGAELDDSRLSAVLSWSEPSEYALDSIMYSKPFSGRVRK